jgi:hypothetical protein
MPVRDVGALERKHGVGRRTVAKALESALNAYSRELATEVGMHGYRTSVATSWSVAERALAIATPVRVAAVELDEYLDGGAGQ